MIEVAEPNVNKLTYAVELHTYRHEPCCKEHFTHERQTGRCVIGGEGSGSAGTVYNSLEAAGVGGRSFPPYMH
jgi:hypothetical protein